MEYLSHSPEETEHIGEMLGRRLRPGTVVAYRGGLGMGKTAFTRGLARGLGCRRTGHQPHVYHCQRIRRRDCRCFTLICTGWAALTSCSTSAGRTI